ncbi:hypothetical protein TRVA0_001S08570 [Trichomonascus vanleenenianus]|uniref:uncharacterized protein n=1 Tax=Trichomonascus vanleenenianus TaxID=2268995 RepID=UPI003ECA66E4
MSSRTINAVSQLMLYVPSAVLFGRVFHVLMEEHKTPITESYGSHFQYLTILGLSVALAAQVVGILSVLTGINALFKLKDTLVLLATPAEFLISIFYWTVKTIDASLLVDPEIGIVPPLWLDMSMHAAPALVLLMDVVFYGERWSLPTVKAIPMFGALSVGYWIWVHHTFSKNGFFPYPLFAIVDTRYRALIFAVSTLVVCISYKVIKHIQGIRSDVSPQKKNQ